MYCSIVTKPEPTKARYRMTTWKCPRCSNRNDVEDTTCLRCGWDAPINPVDGYSLDHKALRAIIPADVQDPAVSLSADGGQHGSHCYDAGILVCGWSHAHTFVNRCQSTFVFKFDTGDPIYCERDLAHSG